jgi:hypothetical protein
VPSAHEKRSLAVAGYCISRSVRTTTVRAAQRRRYIPHVTPTRCARRFLISPEFENNGTLAKFIAKHQNANKHAHLSLDRMTKTGHS